MPKPFTLTLSPQAGRGDLPREMAEKDGEVAAYHLCPVKAGRRCRQADEGFSLPQTTRT